MDKVIKLNSRSGNINTLTKLLPAKGKIEDSKTYLLKGSDEIWSGYDENNKFYVDPSGGPKLMKGVEIDGHKIKSVNFTIGFGFTVTFE